ncbi:MAG: type II secretion system protein, partial [Chloroflexota bacterium]|nr:type II secretion system protein [Chloroflexota bacterium]
MKHDRERGFTLLETVIAMALAATLLPFIGAFYFQAVATTVQESANLAAFDDLRNTSVWLSYDLAQGPAGNNLGLSPSRPPYAWVSIGSSPGYSGNNALTIRYDVWDGPAATTATQYTISYALEDLDPSDDFIQLVRTDETGKKRVMADHIALSNHLIFSGSSLSSHAGGVSEGLTLNMTSTVGGIRGTVARSVPLKFTLPRTFQ